MLLLILIPTYSLSSTKNTCTYLEPGYIQHQLGEIQTLLNKIHLQPHFKNGQAQGHKIVSIQKNSDLLQLKLQKNDIIKQINHRPFTNNSDLAKNLAKLPFLPEFTLTLHRNNAELEFRYITASNLYCD